MNTKVKNIENKKVKELEYVLYLLQNILDELKTDVDTSSDLLGLGIKTKLTSKLEEVINNPFDSLFESSSKLNEKMNELINTLVKKHFSLNKEIIRSVYRSKTSLNNLHYSIVLENDNMENRLKVFEFLNNYELMNVSSNFPVYFQFVPIELIGKIRYTEEITL